MDIKYKHKLNIHSHTMFSDGTNSPYRMALKSKELGFSAAVLTDHFYGHDINEYRNDVSLNKEKLSFLMQSKIEIEKYVMPCIIGVEIPFMGQEILVFGANAIFDVFDNGLPSPEKLIKMKEEAGLVLCHPRGDIKLIESFINFVDAFEHFNSGFDHFVHELPRQNKQRWCNSDAHQDIDLIDNYNILQVEIKTEKDLIKYIKSGVQHEFRRKNAK